MKIVSPLPYLTREFGPIAGRIREQIEDFRVDEIAAYEPTGAGDHTFVRIEKHDLTTPEAVGRLARAVGARRDDCGWAGLKDRRAVTTQWISLPPGIDRALVTAAAVEGVTILEVRPHEHKLRTGHLNGNRFRILVRGVPADRAADIRAMVATLEKDGVPNYFGEQRFGRDAANVERATAWLVDGGRAPRDRFERKLLVSSLQSAIFNRVLANRLDDGLFGTAVLGDVLRKEDTGGLFVAEDMADAAERLAAWALSATGPMLGPQMRLPAGIVLERERAAAEAFGVNDAVIEVFGKAGPGTRRPLRVRPKFETVELSAEGMTLAFELPAGAYATVVLREILKNDALPAATGLESTAPGTYNMDPAQ